MLEKDGMLCTYRLDLPPDQICGSSCRATKIHDHALRFLTYRGTVNKGLGEVRPVDSGVYCVVEEGLETVTLCFEGEVLVGEFSLSRQADDSRVFRACKVD